MVGRGVGVGWLVVKAKTNSKMAHIVEFRVAMVSTYTYKGPIFHYKA